MQYVINYDFPKEAEDYVHRIGRTGRKTKEGYNAGTAIRCSVCSCVSRPCLVAAVAAAVGVCPGAV